ncbi:MAG: TnsA endonuclease N-terminal domain-containing protein [Betaproteobacteria bacterium]|nr:TnsA endonuclease N-terminal domain-containing protein [Betaproteobacteria bacterium]
MPTRRIKASPVKVTGTAPDGQQFESTLEEDFFILLRFNRLVAGFESQPLTLNWLDEKNKIRDYTPDVLIHYRTDLPEAANLPPMLCEVKPDSNDGSESPRRRRPPRKEHEAENRLKWAAAEIHASRQGWHFKVFRESEIRTLYLKNARFLLRFLERPVDSKYEAGLLEHIRKWGQLTLRDWAATIGSTPERRAQVLPACYGLIARQLVDVDLSVPLSLDSVVKAQPDA